MKQVFIDGLEYVPRKVPAEPAKQDIRDYCREHRVWAAKDERIGWFQFTVRPQKESCTWQGKQDRGSELSESNFTFPACPWDKSLIAPDGSMPLMGDQGRSGKSASIRIKLSCLDRVTEQVNAAIRKLNLPARGDPVFVWDETDDQRCPAMVQYFYKQMGKNGCLVFASDYYGSKGCLWDHYRPFDPELVGVPRKDWPK